VNILTVQLDGMENLRKQLQSPQESKQQSHKRIQNNSLTKERKPGDCKSKGSFGEEYFSAGQ
jgi:hypothetical protein